MNCGARPGWLAAVVVVVVVVVGGGGSVQPLPTGALSPVGGLLLRAHVGDTIEHRVVELSIRVGAASFV